MQYYIGIDIGTSAAKALAFSPAGSLLAKSTVAYPLYQPGPGLVELDAATVLDATLKAINDTAGKMGTTPAVISFCTAMHGLMVPDAGGEPLTGLFTWADTRSASQAAELHRTGMAKTLYPLTGVPVHAMSPLCKLLWLREHRPELLVPANRFIDSKTYLWQRLTGKFQLDTAVASATGLLNIHTLHWEPQALQLTGLYAQQLAELVPTGYSITLPAGNALLPFAGETTLVIGSSDGALSNIGTGATDQHRLSITIGTSAAARIMVPLAQTDPDMHSFCYHASEGNYIIGGASSNGAVVLQWLREELLQTNDSYDSLVEAAFAIPAGSEGLVTLPYLLGERAPRWDPAAKAAFIGMQSHHTRAHMVRSAIEGICYNLYTICEPLLQQYPVKSIGASGGFAKSEGWLQLLADLTNLPVNETHGEDAAALGAVMLAATALHLPFTAATHTPKTYRPDAARHRQYREAHRHFEKLYRLLSGQ